MLLISLLVILTGIGGVAHALSNGCVGLHCEDHMQPAEHSALATSGSDVSTPSHHHDPESSGAQKCDPFVCQTIVLLPQNSEAAQGQRDIEPEFQIRAQAKLNEPDSPYRPPDL
ncbi:hypothetical protein [Ruegeria denitrificans]|uniref:hypothetical protein n=1 Tax=Ruegeria denitrificans TaxID=1715692 RepID=UPI00103EDD11|nr:hypothetical protein [Ruegeria denitrificans]